MNDLKNQIVQWAQAKGLLTDITPERIEKQTLKVIEELGETAGAYLKNNKPELKDGIGDVAVTLIILSSMCGDSLDLKRPIDSDVNSLVEIAGCLNDFRMYDNSQDELNYAFSVLKNFAFENNLFMADCMQTAYDVISKRTGKIIGDTFVKD